jgi:divalent metal cation (Fe/Co/Zn/Cd) transporter
MNSRLFVGVANNNFRVDDHRNDRPFAVEPSIRAKIRLLSLSNPHCRYQSLCRPVSWQNRDYVMSHSAAVDRPSVVRRGRRLEYFTISWNTVEGLVAVGAGLFAGSISLVGFGIDSFIEVASGSVLLWRMSVDANVRARERNEKRALRIVGLCFLLLAVYIAFESGSDLWDKRAPEHSIPGVMLACVSLVVMPLLSRSKRKVAHALNSTAMHADAKQTEFCTYLSAILLVGLILNAVFGLWWADPIAALIMVPIIVKEGIEGMQGKTCDDCGSK